MQRIVAPAGTALSTVLSFELAAAYLINSILKLGQPITHICKLPVRNRRECLSRLAQVVVFDARQSRTPRNPAGVLE